MCVGQIPAGSDCDTLPNTVEMQARNAKPLILDAIALLTRLAAHDPANVDFQEYSDDIGNVSTLAINIQPILV